MRKLRWDFPHFFQFLFPTVITCLNPTRTGLFGQRVSRGMGGGGRIPLFGKLGC